MSHQIDVRLQPPKDLDGYFPFTPAKSKEEWERRAEQVRQRILVSEGLWPTPTKTPLNAVIHGRIEQSDYTVEKVYFESLPGFAADDFVVEPAVELAGGERFVDDFGADAGRVADGECDGGFVAGF